MAETPASKDGSKSAGVTDKAKLTAAIAKYRANKSKYSPEQQKKIEARLKSSQQRLGMKVGLSEDGPSNNLAEKIAIFEKNKHRLNPSENEIAVNHLQAEATRQGVTINLSATGIRNPFNAAKHNRGYGGRWAPKAV